MDNKKTKFLYWGVTSFMLLIIGLVYTQFMRIPESFPLYIPFGLTAVFALIVGLIIGISIFVYIDAPKRGLDPWLWMTIAVYIPNLIGLIIYLVMRNNSHHICNNCKNRFSRDLSICPYCGVNHEKRCGKCDSVIDSDWKVCPYCESPLTADQVSTGKGPSKAPWTVLIVILVTVAIVGLLNIIAISGHFNFSSISIGRISSDSYNSMNASYFYHTGTNKHHVKMDAGESLTIDYDCLTNSGLLEVQLTDNDGEIIEVVEQPLDGSIQFTATVEGTYFVKVIAKGAQGEYHVKWKIEP